MTKAEAIIEVLAGKGKVYGLSPNLNGKITYGAGDSLRWNFGTEFVGCDYMNIDGYEIKDNEKEMICKECKYYTGSDPHTYNCKNLEIWVRAGFVCADFKRTIKRGY